MLMKIIFESSSLCVVFYITMPPSIVKTCHYKAIVNIIYIQTRETNHLKMKEMLDVSLVFVGSIINKSKPPVQLYTQQLDLKLKTSLSQLLLLAHHIYLKVQTKYDVKVNCCSPQSMDAYGKKDT